MIEIITTEDVYSPREDSYLFVDNLEIFLKPKYQSIVEIGCGTGIIILNLSISSSRTSVFAIDINPSAARLTKDNSMRNLIDNCHIVIGDGLSSFRTNSFDLVLFNPPYLPIDDLSDKFSRFENLQHIGGEKGYETLSKEIINSELKYDVFVSLISSLSINPNQFAQLLPNFKISILKDLKLNFETLWLISISKVK